MLILAGVSINAVLGDNGIIKQSKLATEETSEKVAREEIKRIVTEYELTSRSQTLEEFLKTKIPDRIDSVINNGDGTLTVSKNGYTVTVDNVIKKEDTTDDGEPEPVITVGTPKVVANSDGTGEALGEASMTLDKTLYITFSHSITRGTTTVSPSIPYAVTSNGTYKFTVTGTVNGETSTKTVSVTVNQYSSKYKIGDYVNYTYDTASNYVLTSATSGSSSNPTDGIPQTAGLKWRILNIDEANGTVDLISENPTDTSVYFSGILGYNNGPYLMNEICKAQYSNKTLGVEARNINLLDMEKQLTAAGIAARNAYKYNSDTAKYGTTKTYTSNTKYPSLYVGQKGAGPNVAEANANTIAQPDITKGNDPYEESKAIATTEPTTDNTSGTGNPLTVTQTYYNISINSTNYGDAYKVLSSSTWFWVASRCVNTNSDYASFGLRHANTNTCGAYMFDSYGSTSIHGNRLRPVVSLSSSILSDAKDASGAWNLK